MKELIRNNYITLSVFKGIMVGVAYHDQILSIVLGPVGIDIHTYMFKSSKN
jgi:hypothetical protein